MPVTRAIDARLHSAFGLYEVLIDALDDGALTRRLGDLPSNEIGQQLWCVVGARESYTRAIVRNGWAGFSCSRIANALVASAAAVTESLAGLEELSEVQERFALALLEHEAQHHGQLIRYLYGLRLPVPDAWKERYSLD